MDYNILFPTFEFKEGIPRKINQIYIVQEGKNEDLPDIILDNISFLKRNNPQWEYKLYYKKDVENYIKKYYGDVIYQYYEKINPEYGAAKADFFRYLLLYKEGGIYIDLKCKFNKPLNSILYPNDTYILSHWDNETGEKHEGWGHFKELKHIKKGEYIMGFIISSKGHPFLRKVILQVLKNIDSYNPFFDGVGKMGVLRTTGPIVYSSVIEREIKNKSANYRLVHYIKDLYLNINIFESKGMFYHKQMLSSNFNNLITPVILNVNFTKFHFYYFSQKRKIDELNRKLGNLYREKIISIRKKINHIKK